MTDAKSNANGIPLRTPVLIAIMICAFLCALLFTFNDAEAEGTPEFTVTADKTEVSLGEELTLTLSVNNYDMVAEDIRITEIRVPVNGAYFEYVNNSVTVHTATSGSAVNTIGYAASSQSFLYSQVDVLGPIGPGEGGALCSFKVRVAGIPEEDTLVSFRPVISVFSKDENSANIEGTCVSDSVTVKKDIPVEDKYYTVRFETEDSGELIAVRTVKEGEGADYPDPPVREGKTFSAWVGDASAVYTDMTVKARYKDKLFVVTFYGLGQDLKATVLSSQNVKWGEDAAAPEVPNVDGFVFTGWNRDFTNVKTALTVQAQYDKAGSSPTATPDNKPTATPDNKPTATPDNKQTDAPTAEPPATPEGTDQTEQTNTPDSSPTSSPVPGKTDDPGDNDKKDDRDGSDLTKILIPALIAVIVIMAAVIMILAVKRKK